VAQLIVGVDVVKGTEIKMDITNDFSESERQFIIELQLNRRGILSTKVINRYVFDNPMQFLKSMTDGLPDKIQEDGLKALHFCGEEKVKEEQAKLSYDKQVEARTKALELAIASCGDRVESMADYVILSIAKHFYTYITKGE